MTEKKILEIFNSGVEEGKKHAKPSEDTIKIFNAMTKISKDYINSTNTKEIEIERRIERKMSKTIRYIMYINIVMMFLIFYIIGII